MAVNFAKLPELLRGTRNVRLSSNSGSIAASRQVT
jgi:hypothetical protein